MIRSNTEEGFESADEGDYNTRERLSPWGIALRTTKDLAEVAEPSLRIGFGLAKCGIESGFESAENSVKSFEDYFTTPRETPRGNQINVRNNNNNNSVGTAVIGGVKTVVLGAVGLSETVHCTVARKINETLGQYVVKRGDEKFLGALGWDSESLTAMVNILMIIQQFLGPMEKVYTISQMREAISSIGDLQKKFCFGRYMHNNNRYHLQWFKKNARKFSKNSSPSQAPQPISDNHEDVSHELVMRIRYYFTFALVSGMATLPVNFDLSFENGLRMLNEEDAALKLIQNHTTALEQEQQPKEEDQANSFSTILTNIFVKKNSILSPRTEVPGAPKTRLLMSDWKSTIFRPSHFVALDENSKSIVVAIRGTMSNADIMTDLICKPHLCKNGFPTVSQMILGAGNEMCSKARCKSGVNYYVHDGMLRSAENLTKTLATKVLAYMDIYKDYELVFTGHSLGASVSALLYLIWKNSIEFKKVKKMRLYAFACPCICSPNVFTENLDLFPDDEVFTVCCQHDVICRLSWRAALHLRNYMSDIVPCLKEAKDDEVEIQQAVWNTLQAGKMTNDDTWIDEKFVNDTSSLGQSKLLPPGRFVYHLVQKHYAHKREPEKMYHCKKVPAEAVGDEIIISSKMFSIHVPQNYENALKSLHSTTEDVS